MIHQLLINQTMSLLSEDQIKQSNLELSLLVLVSGQSYEVRMLDNRKPGELPELNNKMMKVRQPSQLEDKHLLPTSSTVQTLCVFVCRAQ